MRCTICPAALGKVASCFCPWDLRTEPSRKGPAQGKLHRDLQLDPTSEGEHLLVMSCFPHLYLGSVLFLQEPCLHTGVLHPLLVPHRRDQHLHTSLGSRKAFLHHVCEVC